MFVQEDLLTLKWIRNRLIIKDQVDKKDHIIQNIDSIINKISSPIKITLTIDQLDNILRKYYIDFDLDSDQKMNLGFTKEQREKLRVDMLKIARDIVNINKNK